jgi:FkbM family methyltransferase
MNPGQTISLQTANGWAVLPSSLKHPDQSPRFHLHFLAGLAADVGAQHLIVNEANAGYEPLTRDLLERVLRPGDLFVDVGAHWGFFSLLAATHPAGGIDVVAFEPDLTNATMLTENVARNRLANAITIVGAACGNKNELAPLMLNSTMGHSIRGIGLAPTARGGASKWVPVVTLDTALANMGKAAVQRLILKIDAEGFEPNVIVGGRALLAAGRIALIVWECGSAFAQGLGRTAMTQMTALLSDCGFRHLRPPGADGGPLLRFDPQADYMGNVFSVGPQLRDDPIFAIAAL